MCLFSEQDSHRIEPTIARNLLFSRRNDFGMPAGTEANGRRFPFAATLFCVMIVLSASTRAQEDFAGTPASDKSGIRLPPRHNTSDAPTASRSKKSTSTGGVWTTAISLAVIVGCLSLAGYWLKPYLGAPRGLSIDALELLGRRVIEPKVAIHLVRCGRRILVLSLSPEGARTLSEITDPDEVQQLIDACHRQPPVDLQPGLAAQQLASADGYRTSPPSKASGTGSRATRQVSPSEGNRRG